MNRKHKTKCPKNHPAVNLNQPNTAVDPPTKPTLTLVEDILIGSERGQNTNIVADLSALEKEMEIDHLSSDIAFLKQIADKKTTEAEDNTECCGSPDATNGEYISSRDSVQSLCQKNNETTLLCSEVDMCGLNLSGTEVRKRNEKFDETVFQEHQTLLESFQQHQKHDGDQQTFEENGVFQKLISEKNALLQKNEEIQAENQKLREEMATERHTSKIILKKTRKEKDAIIRKLRRITDEVQTEKTVLMEKLADSATSDESLHVMETISEELNEKSAQFSKNAPIEKLNTQDQSEKFRKLYEEACQQLETSEKSLEVQQELNAKMANLSAENRTRHTFEISELQGVIQKLKAEATKQNEELLRVKELERRKTDVLVNVLEDEKQQIRDECDFIKIQLEGANKALQEQKAEFKRQLESETWKLKRAAKAAERRKIDALTASKLEDPEAGNEILYAGTLESLRSKVEHLESKLSEISSSYELKDRAFEELLVAVDQKEQELKTEREKFENLHQEVSEILEKEEASQNRAKTLDEQEMNLESMRIEYEAASHDLMERLTNSDKEKKKLQTELEVLNKSFALKNAELDKINGEKCHFQKEFEVMTQKLEESLSPRKDKATQLESRLEVIQVAAKAQQKRLEEDLLHARESLDQASKRNDELLEKINSLDKKSQLADELVISLNERLSNSKENEVVVSELQKSLSTMQEENKIIQSENAEERAGLVNELIATKDRLKEITKMSSMQENHLTKIQMLEEKLKSTENLMNDYKSRVADTTSSVQPISQKPNALDELFPHLDPVFRQFVELLLQNQNYMYGIFGLFIYAFLIHLYILL